MEQAVDRGRCLVEGAVLRRELVRAWNALPDVSLREAAISLRTRALLTQSLGLPPVRGTIAHGAIGWELSVSENEDRPLREVLQATVQQLLRLTGPSGSGEHIIVQREGNAPRHARA